MSKFDVFISHASPKEDTDLAKLLYKTLEGSELPEDYDGCHVFLAEKTLRASEEWDLAIPEAQKESLVTVVLVSKHMDGAYFERAEIQSAIKMSRGRTPHELVPVYLDGVSPGDNFGLGLKQGLTHKRGDALDDIVGAVLDTLKRIKRTANEWDKIKQRGSFKPGLIQGYVSSQVVDIDYKEAKVDLLDRIQTQGSGRLDERLLYASRFCAREWLGLCANSEYRPYVEGCQLIEDHAKLIVGAIAGDRRSKGYDVVSLGPGSGEKDRSLLHYFAKLDSQLPLCYFPVDVSQYLISQACEEVLKDNVLRKKLRITYINGDFEDLIKLQPIYWENGKPNVFLLLGNTFGNYDESSLLRKLKNGMEPGDYLIIEVQTISDGDYANEKIDFFTVPLGLMGFDVSRLKIETGTSFESSVSGAKTYSTCAKLGRSGPTFQLTRSTQYNLEGLALWLKEREFELLLDPLIHKSAAVLVARYTSK